MTITTRVRSRDKGTEGGLVQQTEAVVVKGRVRAAVERGRRALWCEQTKTWTCNRMKTLGSRGKTVHQAPPHGVDKSRCKLLCNVIVRCGYKTCEP